jgi:hypothetical protein
MPMLRDPDGDQESGFIDEFQTPEQHCDDEDVASGLKIAQIPARDM